MEDDESSEEDDETELDDEDDSWSDQQLVGLPLVRRCTQDFLYRNVYSAKKEYVDSHFVLDIFWTCDIYIYIYILRTSRKQYVRLTFKKCVKQKRTIPWYK